MGLGQESRLSLPPLSPLFMTPHPPSRLCISLPTERHPLATSTSSLYEAAACRVSSSPWLSFGCTLHNRKQGTVGTNTFMCVCAFSNNQRRTRQPLCPLRHSLSSPPQCLSVAPEPVSSQWTMCLARVRHLHRLLKRLCAPRTRQQSLAGNGVRAEQDELHASVPR